MKLVYCSDPLNPRQPDDAYRAEAEAAERLGVPFSLVDHDALTHDGDPARAVRRVPQQSEPGLGLYRGWMLTPDQYRLMYGALDARGVRLLNDPAAYRHCHHLPESYPEIEPHTPRSVWIKTTGDVSTDEIMGLLRPFGPAPVVVKDYVKSRKHEWAEACFIPSAADRQAVERVVGRFLELQGEDLNEGVVFREFVEFEPIGIHPRSGMPLTEEYRTFWLDGVPIDWAPYWDEGGDRDVRPPIERFSGVAAAVRSRFFTMDLARRRDGEWMIVEVGDGQVSGLPRESDADRFYEALVRAWPDGLAREAGR